MLNFDWLQSVSTGMAKGIIISLYVLIGVAVWFLKREYIVLDVESPRPWHNLKWWTTGVLALIIAIYLYF